MNRKLLDALAGKNTGRPPVWLMRQAGRYMPEYRALREKHSLWHLFHHSELAAAITRLPLALGVDAAILFSDILVIVELFGLKLDFPEGKGPVVSPLLTTSRDVDELVLRPVEETLGYVKETIELLKRDLTVPLIGFCGGPFTVASYCIESGTSGTKGDLSLTKKWLYSDPLSFHRLLEKITEASILYLQMQIRAGVDAIQIFDSWAGLLAFPEFETCVLHYLKKMLASLKETKIPIILFCRGSSLWAKELAALNPACISFDWQKPMHELRTLVPSSVSVQGNLDPMLLRAPCMTVKKATQDLLVSMRGDPGFIANLGHGVLPDVPVENVRCFIDTVRSLS